MRRHQNAFTSDDAEVLLPAERDGYAIRETTNGSSASKGSRTSTWRIDDDGYEMSTNGRTNGKAVPKVQPHAITTREFQRIRNKSRFSAWVIHPDEVVWLKYWDVFVIFLLFFISYYVPVQLALIAGQNRFTVTTDVIIDVSLTFDMVLQFLTAYAVQSEHVSAELWEGRPHMIAWRYIAGGWFFVDFLSMLPGWMWLAKGCKEDWTVKKMQWLLLLRVPRLVRMLNRRRVWRLFERVHAQVGFPLYILEFVKDLFFITFVCHWMACAWIMVEGSQKKGQISYVTEHKTWYSVLLANKGDDLCDGITLEMCMYTMALYWAITTITSVGYGDIGPQNMFEHIVCLILMLSSGFVWAYIIGSIVNLISSLDRGNCEFRENMDDLAEMMQNRNLPMQLRSRLRKYMHEARGSCRNWWKMNVLTDTISHGLQREIAKVDKFLLEGVFWARDLEEEAMLEIVKSLQPFFYGPNETLLMREAMIIVRMGVIAVEGRVLVRGCVWGHDTILLDSSRLDEDVDVGSRLICKEDTGVWREYDSASNGRAPMDRIARGTCVIACDAPRWCAGEPDRKGIRTRHMMVMVNNPHGVVNMMFFRMEQPAPRTLGYVDVLMLEKESLREVCRNFPETDRRIRRAQIKTAVHRALCNGAKKRKARMLTQNGQEEDANQPSSLAGALVSQGGKNRSFGANAEPSSKTELKDALTNLRSQLREEMGGLETSVLRQTQGVRNQLNDLTKKVDSLASALEGNGHHGNGSKKDLRNATSDSGAGIRGFRRTRTSASSSSPAPQQSEAQPEQTPPRSADI